MSSKRKGPTRFPLKLKIKPRLRWKGHVKVSPYAGGYHVTFDAIDPKADPQERHVYDRIVMTPEQLEAWTGWRSNEKCEG